VENISVEQVTYQARPGLRLRGDAQAVGERIEALRAASAGELTPQVLVEDARQPDSPLREEFNWNDERAAELYRLNRARGLLNGIVRVVVRVKNSPVQMQQSVRVVQVIQNPDGKSINRAVYISPEAAFSREDWRAQVFESCQRQIADLEGRLRRLGETEETVAALARVREQLARKAAGPKAKGKPKRRPQPAA
jgi:hypothetical protein